MTSTSSFLALPCELRVEILRQSLPLGMIQVVDHPVSQRACTRRRRWMRSRCQNTSIDILRDWCDEVEQLSLPSRSKLKYFDCSGQTINPPKSISPTMSLLLSCRQVHQEAISVVYDQYIFSFDSVRVFCDFLRLHKYASQHIRTLMVAHIFIPGPCPCTRYQYPLHWGSMMLSNPLFSTVLENVFLHMPRLWNVRLLLDNEDLLEDLLWTKMDSFQTQTVCCFREMAHEIVKLAERRRGNATTMPFNHWELLVLPNWMSPLPANNGDIRGEIKDILDRIHGEVCSAV